MFDRLLIPLDGSPAAEAAIPYAELIPSDHVRLLMVEPEPVSEPTPNQLGTGADTYLRRAGAPFERQGRYVEIVVATGDPANWIVQLADDCNLIVMTTHGRGAGARALFGSVADQVVRRATAATLVVRVDAGGVDAESPRVAHPMLTRLIVPLDGSPLAEQALPVAVGLADLLGLPIHLVRVIVDDPVRDVVRAGRSAAAAQQRQTAAVQQAAEHDLARVVQTLRNQNLAATSEIRRGSPGEELVALSRPSDLVVMSSHGRGGFRRWLLGSVAEHLVRFAPAPVLLIRSDDTRAPATPN